MKRWLLSLLLIASPAFAQGYHVVDVMFSSTGPANRGTVRVCTSAALPIVAGTAGCTPLASIYSDQALTKPLANPITTDRSGNFDFWVAQQNSYVVEYFLPNTTLGTKKQITVPCVSGCGGAPTTNTLATLPGSATEGTIANLTDGARGQYVFKNSTWRPGSPEINVQDFGARGDGGTYSQVQCVSGSGTISNVGLIAGKLPKVGDLMLISGCGAAGADLTGTVTGGTATTGTLFGSVTLGGGVTAGASLVSRGAIWGVSIDDTTAFINAISYCQNTVTTGGCTIRVPSGVFVISNVTLPVLGTPSLHNGQVRILGAGRSSTWIVGIGADQSAIFTAPANSVSTDIENMALTSYDYNNKTQWAVQWKGGTEHTFQNNFVTQTYGMVSAANTWYNLIFNNRCYGAAGDCIEFGGAAGTGPVNNTNVISNVLSEAHGWHIHSHTNNGSWGNTYIGNDQEQSVPFVGLIMIGESNTNFQGGYLETTNQGASGGFDVVINGNGNFSWATWPCTQINGTSGVRIYGTASSSNTCAVTPNFVNVSAGTVFYGPALSNINTPTTAAVYGAQELATYGGFAFREALGPSNPYLTTTQEWSGGHGSTPFFTQSVAPASANVPSTPITTSAATFGTNSKSSMVWNSQLNAAAGNPTQFGPMGWICESTNCVSSGGGNYSAGNWWELPIVRQKRVRELSAVPVSGTWNTGDRVDNIAPTNTIANPCTSQFINVSGGAPGTFVNVPCGVNVMKTTVTLSPAIVAANTCAEQTFALAGVLTTDLITVNKPTAQAGLGVSGARASSAGNIGINFCNNTGAGITPTASEVYAVGILR